MGKAKGNKDKTAFSLSSNNTMQNTSVAVCTMIILYKIFNFETAKESSQPINIKQKRKGPL